MTDENTEQPRPDEVAERSVASQGPQGGSETIPAASQDGAGDATAVQPEVDHSVWMRPAVGEPRRTSEVVGALAPPEPEVEPGAEPIDLFEEAAPVTPQEAAEEDEVPDGDEARGAHALDAITAGALVGARAAAARLGAPGASLLHAPDEYDQDTYHTARRPGWQRLLPWLAAALAAGLVVFGAVYSFTRKPVVVVTPTPTPSVSKPPVVTDAVLMTPTDASRMDAKAKWSTASTLTRLTPTSLRPICQNSTQGQPNPTTTRQRTLTTTSTKALAALHQVDGFATTADARNAYAARAARMASCDDVPTWIHSAASVSGFGDQATAMTIAYQDPVVQYHTVVLARTGTTVHAIDVTQANQPLGVPAVVGAARAAINRQCATSGGECAQRPVVRPAVPPVSGTAGWLIPSDLQRVSPGAGLWNSTDTTNVTARGSQCENMTLAAAPGPVKREQRVFQMTQDSAAPQNFGIDEVVLTFKDAPAASSFAAGLQKNLASCPSRMPTAKSGQAASATSRIATTPVTAQTLLVSQSVGGTETVRFRTAVVTAGNKVVYLSSNPSPSYDLGSAKFTQIALRAGERATQAR